MKNIDVQNIILNQPIKDDRTELIANYDYSDCSPREYIINNEDGVYLMRYRKQPNRKYSVEELLSVRYRNYNDADSEDDSYEDDYCDMEYDKNCEEES
jgi:hypothetical protein